MKILLLFVYSIIAVGLTAFAARLTPAVLLLGIFDPREGVHRARVAAVLLSWAASAASWIVVFRLVVSSFRDTLSE